MTPRFMKQVRIKWQRLALILLCIDTLISPVPRIKLSPFPFLRDKAKNTITSYIYKNAGGGVVDVKGESGI